MPKVSVLLPVYNGELTLGATFDSILNQTFSDFEILISDDNSSDGSWRLIEELSMRDARVRPFQFRPGKGLAQSLNALIGEAKGEYLMRIDQDDLCLPRRMEAQVRFLDEHPSIAVVGSQAYHMGRNESLDRLISLPTAPEDIYQTLRSYNCMYHPATMIRRSAVLLVQGYRGEFKNAEDYDLWLRMSRKFKLANLPEPLIRYRFSTSGMTLSRKWEQLYFVCLAQVADQNPDASLRDLVPIAQKKHQELGKQNFLEMVYKGTIDELIRLGFRGQAIRIWYRMFREVGWLKAMGHLVSLTK